MIKKYLNFINENHSLDLLKKEVEEIFYILRDEGARVKIFPFSNELFTIIVIKHPDAQRTLKSEEFLEFKDRLEEICHKYNKIVSNARCDSNNIGIAIYNESDARKTIKKKGLRKTSAEIDNEISNMIYNFVSFGIDHANFSMNENKKLWLGI